MESLLLHWQYLEVKIKFMLIVAIFMTWLILDDGGVSSYFYVQPINKNTIILLNNI